MPLSKKSSLLETAQNVWIPFLKASDPIKMKQNYVDSDSMGEGRTPSTRPAPVDSWRGERRKVVNEDSIIWQ